MYYIYKIKNVKNKKCYVGITDNIERRWKTHIYLAKSLEKPLYKAIRKYGIDNFSFSVIFETNDKEIALNKEISTILEYNSYGKGGYNLTEGGYIPNEDLRKKASERMKNNNPMKTLRTNSGSFKKGQKPKITPERNEKIRNSKIGKLNPNFGNKNAANHMNVLMTCEYCQKTISKGNYYRWHGKNCKSAT